MTISRTFTDGDDEFIVSTEDDYLLKFLGGDDRLVTRAGTTTAEMGTGNDQVRIEGGSATIYGQSGADRFDVYGQAAWIDGGADNDLFNIRGGSSHRFTGRDGNDRFNFLSDTIDVRLNGNDGADLFAGYSRSISGSLFGGAGNDRFLSFGNHDGLVVALYGGTGNDLYRLDPDSPARVVEYSGAGTDTVQIYRGEDYTLGANLENAQVLERSGVAGGSTVVGNGLANQIRGSAGDDTINGLAGNDRLYGGGGMDTLDGGGGNDRIVGGAWNDVITSGAGNDVIVYNSVSDAPSGVSWHYEHITDWDPADTIDLSAIDANELLAGNQAFEFAGYTFGGPPAVTDAGTLTICGFGGELYIIAHTDGDGVEDLVISLYSAMGESGLTVADLIL